MPVHPSDNLGQEGRGAPAPGEWTEERVRSALGLHPWAEQRQVAHLHALARYLRLAEDERPLAHMRRSGRTTRMLCCAVAHACNGGATYIEAYSAAYLQDLVQQAQSMTLQLGGCPTLVREWPWHLSLARNTEARNMHPDVYDELVRAAMPAGHALYQDHYTPPRAARNAPRAAKEPRMTTALRTNEEPASAVEHLCRRLGLVSWAAYSTKRHEKRQEPATDVQEAPQEGRSEKADKGKKEKDPQGASRPEDQDLPAETRDLLCVLDAVARLQFTVYGAAGRIQYIDAGDQPTAELAVAVVREHCERAGITPLLVAVLPRVVSPLRSSAFAQLSEDARRGAWLSLGLEAQRIWCVPPADVG